MMDHVDALTEVGLDPAIWRWMPYRVRDRAGMQAFVEESLEGFTRGSEIPFVTTLRDTGQIVGATRFMNITLTHRRVEIGGTWIAPAWQRSRVNTEAKYLMLRHAFEHWNCRRVEFKTHALNTQSRSAIQRLGAVEEGILRKHLVQEDGSSRDSVYFSIVDDEWPAVKQKLEATLASDR
jgi:RimJ/RimL family protein N-acetyltransferase